MSKRMWDKNELIKIAERHSGELTPESLSEVLEGSSNVVVDINEAGTKVQVSLDQDVVDEIDGKLDATKSAISTVGGLVIPSDAPTDTVLVAVETDREQSQVYLGTGIELGNSTSPYNMNVVGVADERTGNEIKIWTGTQAQYDAITTKSNTTIYYILEV